MAAFATVDDGGGQPYDSPTPPYSTGRLLTSDFSQARAFVSLLRRIRSWGDDLLFPTLTFVHFDELLHGRRILRLLVLLPKGDQPRKAQRIARLSSDFSGRMGRRMRDLLRQHLDDEVRLEPHPPLHQRGDTGRPRTDVPSCRGGPA